MTSFPVEDGGVGFYEAGLIRLQGGIDRGVEEIAAIAPRGGGSGRRLPGMLGTLRGALPAADRMPVAMRLAVSTVRAGLGAIEEELGPGSDRVAVEIAFTDGSVLAARMPPALVATLRRDRDIALGALARLGRPSIAPSIEEGLEADEAANALTSIFRYEKRNGRLRRVAGSGTTSKG